MNSKKVNIFMVMTEKNKLDSWTQNFTLEERKKEKLNPNSVSGR
jgi:serine protease inhibitor